MPRGCRKGTTIELIGGIYCHICDKVFDSKNDYELHYILHDKADAAIQYTCVVCHQILTGYSKFRNHCYNMHTNANKFKCEHCDKSFHKQGVLDLHVNTVHTFKCKHPNCKKQFPSEKQLHMHEFIHRSKANKPPYQCKTCNETINGTDECEQHVDDHSSVCYYCPICNIEITNETAMKHLVTHFGPDSIDIENEKIKSVDADYSSIMIVGGILCYLCQEVSKNRQELDLHFEESHPDCEIAYTCIICDKQYSKYHPFGCHIYEHLWKNKFECEQCPRLFPRLALLVQHVTAAHSGGEAGEVGTLLCELCDRAFATKWHRRHHMRRYHHHHHTTLSCTQQGCNRTFESPKALVLHEKMHSGWSEAWCRRCGLSLSSAAAAARHLPVHAARRYACPVCDAHFNEKRLVADHVTRHFESVFHMCKVCAKVFEKKKRLMAHLKTHATVKRYECQHCGRSFAKTNHLEQHIALHSTLKPYKCIECDKSFTNYPNYHKHLCKIHKIDPKMLNKADVDKKIVNANDMNPTVALIKTEASVASLAEPPHPFVESDPNSMDPDSIDSIEIDKDSQIFKNFSGDDCPPIEFDSDIEDMLIDLVAPAVEVTPLPQMGPQFDVAPVPAADFVAPEIMAPRCIDMDIRPQPQMVPHLPVTPVYQTPSPLRSLRRRHYRNDGSPLQAESAGIRQDIPEPIHRAGGYVGEPPRPPQHSYVAMSSLIY